VEFVAECGDGERGLGKGEGGEEEGEGECGSHGRREQEVIG
jgi:hypothetical protein